MFLKVARIDNLNKRPRKRLNFLLPKQKLKLKNEA